MSIELIDLEICIAESLPLTERKNLLPNTSCVYMLFQGDQLQNIGETGNLFARLYVKMKGKDRPCWKIPIPFDRFFFMPVDYKDKRKTKDRCRAIEGEWIREFSPPYNNKKDGGGGM